MNLGIYRDYAPDAKMILSAKIITRGAGAIINNIVKDNQMSVYVIKTSGSESPPRKVELASAHKKRDDYRKYFTHNNEACKNPYKTTLSH